MLGTIVKLNTITVPHLPTMTIIGPTYVKSLAANDLDVEDL